MYFRLLLDETCGSLTYLLGDLEGSEAVLIDPRGPDVSLLNAMLEERRLRLRWVLRTHEHDEHLPGELDRLRGLGAPLIQHSLPESTSAVIEFGSEHIHALPTPGHTAACLSFLWRDRLFCGGLLAADTCPYQPRPAAPEALWDSVTRKVFTLPSETLLFSSYAMRGGYVSTVHEQRLHHPWFARASRDDFLQRIAQAPNLVKEDS